MQSAIQPPTEAIKDVSDWLTTITKDSHLLDEKTKEIGTFTFHITPVTYNLCLVSKIARLVAEVQDSNSSDLESTGIGVLYHVKVAFNLLFQRESFEVSYYSGIISRPSNCSWYLYAYNDNVSFIISDGHTYERSAIMSWLMEGNRRSPVTNTILPNTMLIQNHCIKAVMVHTHHIS